MQWGKERSCGPSILFHSQFTAVPSVIFVLSLVHIARTVSQQPLHIARTVSQQPDDLCPHEVQDGVILQRGGGTRRWQ